MSVHADCRGHPAEQVPEDAGGPAAIDRLDQVIRCSSRAAQDVGAIAKVAFTSDDNHAYDERLRRVVGRANVA